MSLRLKRDRRGVSNIIVVALSLVIILVIVSNIVLWSYEMNQLDWEKMKEDIAIVDVMPNRETWSYNPSGYTLGGSTSWLSGDVSNLTSDDGVYMAFRSYYSGTDASDFVDIDTSDVDSSADKGTHSNFTAQQYGPDSIYDTLTEAHEHGMGTEVSIEATLYDATDEYVPGPKIVFINDTHGYVFYQKTDGGMAEICYSKSTNGGTSWTYIGAIDSATQYTFRAFSVWYDKWTVGDTGTKIHIAANCYDDDIVHYNYLDTSDDSTRGSWANAFGSGAYNAPDTATTLAKSSDGYLFFTSGGTNGFIVGKSTDGGSNWGSDIAPSYGFFGDDDDQAQILPLSDGDMLVIYEDITADTLYSFVYDEATDTWDASATTVTTIATHATYYAPWGAVFDKSTNDTYLAVNTASATAGGDLKAYKFSDSSRSWSALTDIYTDIGAGGGTVKMAIDQNNQDLYAICVRGTVGTDTHIYYKKSTNGGSSWGSENQVSSTLDDNRHVTTNFMSDERIYAGWFDDDNNDLFGNTVADISPDYELDLEIQWTNADYDETNEELCIYAYEGNNTKSLDATGGYMIVGDGTPDWGSTTGTISFWIQWDTVANRPWGQHDNMETRFSGTNLVIDWGAAGSIISSTSFAAGKWYFIAIIWDENTDDLYLYVGDQDNPPAQDTYNNAWTSTVSTVGVTQNNFMASKGGVEPTDGHGDDLRYWNIDRTLTEIQSDYNTELTGSETNLRSYFKLNNNFDDIGPDNNDGSGSGSYSFSSDVPFGTPPTENIRVDVWNGTAWQNVFTNLTNGWNNVSVSSYLDSSTFTIRFRGGNESGDTIQNSWDIDVTMLHVWSGEYTLDVEFTGSSNTEDWTQLNWTLNSAWTIGSVNVTLQLYNYTLGGYSASGNGYIAYTSDDTQNTDENKSQTINVNPTHFRNATDYWKMKVKGVKATDTQFDFKADWIEFKAVKIGTFFTFKNEGSLTSHLVSLWVNNSTNHQRYDINVFVNSAETTTYLRADISLPTGQYTVKVVTERGNTAIYSGS